MNIKLLVLSIFLLVLSGCTSPGTVPPSVSQQAYVAYDENDLEDILEEIENSPAEAARELRLKATDIALSLGLYDQAREILRGVKESETSGLSNLQYRLHQARIRLKDNQPVAALEWLNTKNLDELGLNPPLQIQWGMTKAEAYLATQNFITSARERIFYDGLLDADRRKVNHEHILRTLTVLPAKSLVDAIKKKKGITQDFHGWLSLAALVKTHQLDPFKQFEELRIWQQQWPEHPAAIEPPASLELLAKVVADRPGHLALLLPLQGNLAPLGRAIRDGILASHFHFIQQHKAFPKISIIDTSDVSMEIAYELAITRGADFIIGPLQREKVIELIESASVSVPVLALNRMNEPSSYADLFQFGLAPEDEVIQIADQAKQQGFQNALAIIPNSKWGNRNFDTFRQYWEKIGGNLVDFTTYEDSEQSGLIENLLKVNSSQSRASVLKQTIGENFEFNPRRRQDVDFIFLLGNSSQASSVNPAIGYHYAEDIPVYSTSHVHDNTDSKINNMDLNNIRFCEIPFKLDNEQPVQKQVIQLWPTAKGQLAAFYALGIDAYHLHPRLQQMKLLPGERIYGTTGIISLDADNIIRRRLMWAQFKRGKAESMPLIMEAPAFQ